MTGPYQNANPHTLGIVVAAAYAIENCLRQKKIFEECQAAQYLSEYSDRVYHRSTYYNR
jgi:hypothetical protein